MFISTSFGREAFWADGQLPMFGMDHRNMCARALTACATRALTNGRTVSEARFRFA
jgi:hypothetical protein